MHTVAVVDDEPVLCQFLQAVAEEHCGCRVEVYPDGRDFLAGYAPKRGCVVLNINMPGVNGIDVLDELTRRGWRVPVVTFSGHVPREYLEGLARRWPCWAEHRQKPCHSGIMAEVIREACQRCPVVLVSAPVPPRPGASPPRR